MSTTYKLTVGDSNRGYTRVHVKAAQRTVRFPGGWSKGKTSQHRQALRSAARELASVSVSDRKDRMTLSGLTQSGDYLPVTAVRVGGAAGNPPTYSLADLPDAHARKWYRKGFSAGVRGLSDGDNFKAYKRSGGRVSAGGRDVEAREYFYGGYLDGYLERKKKNPVTWRLGQWLRTASGIAVKISKQGRGRSAVYKVEARKPKGGRR